MDNNRWQFWAWDHQWDWQAKTYSHSWLPSSRHQQGQESFRVQLVQRRHGELWTSQKWDYYWRFSIIILMLICWFQMRKLWILYSADAIIDLWYWNQAPATRWSPAPPRRNFVSSTLENTNKLKRIRVVKVFWFHGIKQLHGYPNTGCPKCNGLYSIRKIRFK